MAKWKIKENCIHILSVRGMVMVFEYDDADKDDDDDE